MWLGMTTSTSSTVAVTSNVQERAKAALLVAAAQRAVDRREHLNEVLARAADLTERGLLVRQAFSAPSTSELAKRYLVNDR
jgi:hypothetical protein